VMMMDVFTFISSFLLFDNSLSPSPKFLTPFSNPHLFTTPFISHTMTAAGAFDEALLL